MIAFKEFANFMTLNMANLTATYARLLAESGGGYRSVSLDSRQASGRKLLKAVIEACESGTPDPLTHLFFDSQGQPNPRWPAGTIESPNPFHEIECLGQTLTPVVTNLEAGKFLWQILSEVRAAVLQDVAAKPVSAFVSTQNWEESEAHIQQSSAPRQDEADSLRAMLEQRNAELELILEASLSVTSNLGLKAVLDEILNSAFKLLPGLQDVHIFLYQDEHVSFASSLWADGRKDYQISEPRPGGLTYKVAQQGETIVVPDLQNHPLYPNPPAEWRGALAGIPLKIGQRVVGVMNVAYEHPHSFKVHELGLLRLLGDQTAVAIQNAHLYEQAQQELTERKQMEEQLHWLSRADEQSPIVVIITDISGQIEYVNPKFSQITGYTPAEVIGQNPRILKSDKTSTEQYKQLWQMISSGGEWRGELQNKKKNGEPYWISSFISPIRNSAGVITHFLSVQEDITERKQTEQELQEHREHLEEMVEARTAELEKEIVERREVEKLLRTIIDATPDWIFIKDQEHRYRLVNQGYANSLHLTPDDFIDKNDLDLGFPEDIVKGNPEKGIRGFWPDDTEVMESGETKLIEVEPAVVDDQQIFLRTLKVPLRDADGQVWGVLGFVSDITERERLLAEVERHVRRERTIRQITEKMRAASSLEGLVKVTASELGQRLSAGHAVVELGITKADEPDAVQSNGKS